MVKARIDIIGKLHFHDGFEANGAHTYGGSNDIGFLYSGVEHTMIAKLFSQGSCFTEYASQSSAHILSIEHCFRKIFHQFPDGKERSVYHDDLVSFSIACSISFFFCYRRWNKNMISYSSRIRFGALYSQRKLVVDELYSIFFQLLQFLFCNAGLQEPLAKFRTGIVLQVLVPVILRAVEFFSHTAGMMPE